MLIIPLTGNMSWRNPPTMTIIFILINCFAFFAFQLDDDTAYFEAANFYVNSELVSIEKKIYIDYLKNGSHFEKATKTENLSTTDQQARYTLFRLIRNDGPFNKKLNRGEIFTKNDPQYEKWSEQKKTFNKKLASVVFWEYGFKPAQQSVISYFTHMFLHGGFMHLFGNMIFLWLVGSLIEIGAGRSLFLLGYLVTGLFAVTGFGLIYHNSLTPLVGASGAIAGLMGIYTVLYGKTKVDIFYSIGFYFNKTRIPAIVLLPFWIGNEIYQLQWNGPSNVAYVAHLGGLISGAGLGFIQLRYLGGLKEDLFAEKPTVQIAKFIEKGLQALAELDLQKARSYMNQALDIDPANKTILVHLFNIEKMAPENDAFHMVATRTLNRLYREKTLHNELFAIYNEYKRIAKPSKLSADLYAQLSVNFAENGRLEESSRILALLLKKNPAATLVPTGLLTLARSYLKQSMAEKGRNCLNILCKRYPESPECRTATQILRQNQ